MSSTSISDMTTLKLESCHSDNFVIMHNIKGYPPQVSIQSQTWITEILVKPNINTQQWVVRSETPNYCTEMWVKPNLNPQLSVVSDVGIAAALGTVQCQRINNALWPLLMLPFNYSSLTDPPPKQHGIKKQTIYPVFLLWNWFKIH